jgi:hypothetical protein
VDNLPSFVEKIGHRGALRHEGVDGLDQYCPVRGGGGGGEEGEEEGGFGIDYCLLLIGD